MLCKALGVSPQSYYASRNRAPSNHAKVDKRLGNVIEVLFYEYKRRYGAKRIHQELKDNGLHHGRKRVSRLMKERELEAKGKKRFRVTTDSKHQYPVAPNVLERNFLPVAPNQVWAGDITYLWTTEGWMYLAVFIDLFSRKVVGWATSKRLTSSFVLLAFERALARRKPPDGLLVHTDRGSQYASELFRKMLLSGNCSLSMSRKGNCWDNAVVESFFARFKVEAIHGEKFQTRKELEFEVFDYIERFYNQRRKHSTLEYLSPNLYEIKYQEAMIA
jgi:transposase InsO family protein